MSSANDNFQDHDFITNGGKKIVIDSVKNMYVVGEEHAPSDFSDSILLIANGKSQKDTYAKKIKLLESPDLDINWQYNELLLKYFVKRRCKYYHSEKKISLNGIKSEILRPAIARNIILTGKAGIGKSTALKWLFVNSYHKDYQYIYLTSRMFNDTDGLEQVCEKIGKFLTSNGKCLVFFDGLDELRCIKGVHGELERFLNYFDKKSGGITQNSQYRFIIATRSEHFAFHNVFAEKKAKKNLDRYVVFEILPLNYNESLKICLTIKYFSKFDKKHDVKHFTNKWPEASSDNSYALPEKKYKKVLKEYLVENNNSDNFLLSAPLLCRYAYQIVCEWADTDNSFIKNSKSLSTRIETALTSYVKWEFHDEYDMTTSGTEGNSLFKEYKKEIFSFLTSIASFMENSDMASREQWEQLKNESKNSVNAAFCILQEQENGKLSFIHKSFKDFFLARYYVRKLFDTAKDGEITDSFIENIQTNHGFCTLFVEQMLEKGNALSKSICSAIAENNPVDTNDDFTERIVDFFTGKIGLMYTDGMPFTIAEYLYAFPCGRVLYAGIEFDRMSLEKMQKSRILHLNNTDLICECHASSISSRIDFCGVIYNPDYVNEYKIFTTDFSLYFDRSLTDVGGYLFHSFTRQDLIRILSRNDVSEQLGDGPIALKDIIESSLMDYILKVKKWEDMKGELSEKQRLITSTQAIIDFLNPEKNYWCLLKDNSLFVCEISKTNSSVFKDFFFEQLPSQFFDYINLFGNYRSLVLNEASAYESYRFRPLSEVEVTFDTGLPLSKLQIESVMSNYYYAHWKNYQLVRSFHLSQACSNAKQIDNNVIMLKELLEIYKNIDVKLEKNPDEKLFLIISDEKLITYYIGGFGEKMVALANDTLSLCQKYGHTKGEEFRRFLISEETSFTGNDREVVQQYTQDYIWF